MLTAYERANKMARRQYSLFPAIKEEAATKLSIEHIIMRQKHSNGAPQHSNAPSTC